MQQSIQVSERPIVTIRDWFRKNHRQLIAQPITLEQLIEQIAEAGYVSYELPKEIDQNTAFLIAHELIGYKYFFHGPHIGLFSFENDTYMTMFVLAIQT